MYCYISLFFLNTTIGTIAFEIQQQVFRQFFSLLPTYALIYIVKILSQTVILLALLRVSIRTDHHQGVSLVLAKLLIKIVKL